MGKSLKEWCSSAVASYKLYSSISDFMPISRRYFIVGYFDGILTLQGMILGSYLSGRSTSGLIISAGIATAIALGISSGWGAYEAEMVEQRAIKRRKEKSLMKKVDGSITDRAHKYAIWISAVVHAVSPILSAVITISPFIFLEMEKAFYIAIGAGFVQLFVIGALMGKVSRTNMVVSGLRLTLAGIVTLIIVTILNPSHFG